MSHPLPKCVLPGRPADAGGGGYSGWIGAAPGYTAEEPCRKNETLRCGNTELHIGGSITQMLVAIHVMVIGARDFAAHKCARSRSQNV